MRKRRLTDPLRRPLFRRLATTYTVNELGDWMGIIALSVLVFDRTDSALATAGLFLGTRFLPALLAPILVARAERPPPRFALPVIYCGEAAAFGALALLASNFSLAAVIALATIDGALALTGRSLTRAVVAAQLEPAGELRAGNALLNVAFTGGAAIGPALAGLVVAGFGVQTALLLDAVSFYVIALILLTAGPMPRAEPEGGRMRDRVKAGIAYIREKAALRRLLIAQGAAFIFFAAVIPVEVVYAKETLGAGDSGYGLMLASWGVGMVLGSLVFAVVRRVSLALLLFYQHPHGRRRLPRPRRGADPGGGLRGLGARRHRQRGAVGVDDQRRAGDDGGRNAGPGDERAGVDRGGDAGGRVHRRRRHRRHREPAHGVPDRRRRRLRDRRDRDPDSWRQLA